MSLRELVIKRATIVGALAALLVLVLAVAAGFWILVRRSESSAAGIVIAPRSSSAALAPGAAADPPIPSGPFQGFLYGRVTTVTGKVHEGRLRWGHGEEALWSDYFNGYKAHNPWAAMVAGRLPKVDAPIVIFGFEVARHEETIEVDRPLMVRFGAIARLDAELRQVRVTLKNGSVYPLARLEASDFDDGLRVWDARGRIVDLDTLEIRSVELLPTPPLDDVPRRLHGTVHTREGDFTGFLQWNRTSGLGTDELVGKAGTVERKLPFDTIRSIARRTRESAVVTLRDGSEVVLAGTEGVGKRSRGVYVDDSRYGRVLVSWDAFVRLDLDDGGPGPSYGDFPAGGPLHGTVTAADRRKIAGRVVFDLDEAETTDTLDAPAEGIDYTLPFGLVAVIAKPAGESERVTVTLRGGETLRLERSGDLGDGNAGVLVFPDGVKEPEYLLWGEVERIELDAPAPPPPPSP